MEKTHKDSWEYSLTEIIRANKMAETTTTLYAQEELMDIRSLFSLEGKTALITGGSQGIGKATALAFADAGADVAVVSRKIENLEPVADEIRAKGRKALAVPVHMGRMDQMRDMAGTVIKEFGKIDILVNNAATSPAYATVLDAEERLWDSIMNLNIKGLYFLTQIVAKTMKEKNVQGSIINVSSIDGFAPQHFVGIYSISKAAVNMATRSMALELAADRIRVNAIAPGATRTNLLEGLFVGMSPEQMETELAKYEETFPLKRIALPEDMIGAMLFLASGASSYVTGQIIPVEGGALLSHG